MAYKIADRDVDEGGIHQRSGTTVLQHVIEAPPGRRFWVTEQQLPIYQASAAHHGRDDLVFKVRPKGTTQ